MVENNELKKIYEREMKNSDKVDNFGKKNNIKFAIKKFSLNAGGDMNEK